MCWKAGKEDAIVRGRGHFLTKRGSKKPLHSTGVCQHWALGDGAERESGNRFKEKMKCEGLSNSECPTPSVLAAVSACR